MTAGHVAVHVGEIDQEASRGEGRQDHRTQEGSAQGQRSKYEMSSH